jgi:hypothetical protein
MSEKTSAKKGEETKQVDKDMLSQVLESIEMLRTENAQLKAEVESVSRQQKNDIESDTVSSERKPAEILELLVIDGKPITDMKLEPEMAVDHKGNEYTKRMQATCTVFGNDKPVKLSYGEISNPKDFLNLSRKKFTLINRDPSELSGASKIIRGQIVDNFGKTPEIDRSSGSPVKTGKMVELVTKKDIRFYTIDVDGEPCELHEDKIYR